MSWITIPVEINHNYKSFKRFLRIIETAAAYGFSELAEQVRPARCRKRRCNAEPSLCDKTRPEKLRMLLEKLGPTFVKLGQVLSTRPDLITEEYAKELAKLTEKVPPFPYEEVERILREELGRELKEVYAEFSPAPLAAASIGQVHAAKLKDGTEVVVKVQRPGIHETVAVDLEIMFYLARKLDALDDTIALYQPERIVEEFAYSLRRELNYQYEAANLLCFEKAMEGMEEIVIPKLYSDYSTMRVMTMQRIFGDSAATVLADEAVRKKYDLPKIAELGVQSLLKQIFEAGFFHADPHPGNIFLLEGNRISFIDFGMVGKISSLERLDFVRIVDYMLRGEIRMMTDTALRMTINGKFTGRRSMLERQVSDLVDENINLPLEKLSVAHILEELMELFNRFQLTLKPDLYMMFKALITIEHLGRSFDPKLKIIEMVKPFVHKVKLGSYNPLPSMRIFLDSFDNHIDTYRNLPQTVAEIITKAEKGELALRIEHHRLDDIEETVYKTGERMSRSVMIAALLIGSALIMASKLPPYLGDGQTPLIGIVGFLGSGILSVLALFSDYRNRKQFLRMKKRRKRREEERE